MVFFSPDPNRGCATTVFLCARGWRQRARVLQPRTQTRKGSAVLRIAVPRLGRRRTADDDCRNGGALSERDSPASTGRTVLYRRTIFGRHDRVRDGVSASCWRRRGCAARAPRFVSGWVRQKSQRHFRKAERLAFNEEAARTSF